MSAHLSTKFSSRLDGVEFPMIVEGECFRLFRIEWSEGKSVEFRQCDFSRSLISRCYFHRAKFINCNFTGACFSDTNLRGAAFVQCKFEYAQFKNTLVDAGPMLDNMPAWENVRRELLRSLRKNAESIGEMADVRKYFYAEMDASAEHWRSAFRQTTGYYKQHYSGWSSSLNSLMKLTTLKISKWFWGYGDSPAKLLTSVTVWVLLLSIVLSSVLDAPHGGWNATQSSHLCANTWLVFLGVSSPLSAELDSWLLALIHLSRYVFLGLLASVAIRRYTRR